MQAESFGDAAAISPKGAMGLMQIMPRTWAELRDRYGLGANPYDPHDNVFAGAAYLRELYDRYGPDGFLAAYNAGPGRYEEHVNCGRALPPETLAYVEQIPAVHETRLMPKWWMLAANRRPRYVSRIRPKFAIHDRIDLALRHRCIRRVELDDQGSAKF